MRTWIPDYYDGMHKDGWLIRDDCTPAEIAAFLLDMIRRLKA